MNRGKWIILGGATALLVWTLSPPKIGTFVVHAPASSHPCAGRLDLVSLFAGWALIATVTGALYFVFRQRKDRAPVSTEK